MFLNSKQQAFWQKIDQSLFPPENDATGEFTFRVPAVTKACSHPPKIAEMSEIEKQNEVYRKLQAQLKQNKIFKK